MQLRIGPTRLRIDWLTLLLPIVAAALGEGRTAAIMSLSLFVHEAAHYLAARALSIRFHSLRLTPFGGMSQIENPYAISAPRLCAVSAAGPAANLLLVLLSAALCHWQLISFQTTADLIAANALLMLFNLLPALPLDGGRILYGILSAFLPRRRAVEIGILSGRILALILLLTTIGYGICRKVLNLSPLFAALFLLASASDERRALTDSRIHHLIDNLKPLAEPQPASIIAIDASASPEAALRCASPDRITLYAVFRNGQFDSFIDERTLTNRLIEMPDNASTSSNPGQSP